MDAQLVSADAVIAAIAANQYGAVTYGQLIAAGIGRGAITRRVQSGHLHRVYRAVYAVGHPSLSNEGRWMAAVLACGDKAVLSHRSAAELWRLLPPIPGPVQVTVRSAGGRARRGGLHLHRRPLLPVDAATVRDGIPVTAPLRTLSDLDGLLEPYLVRRAIRQAEYLGLASGVETDHTRSDAERDFLRLCRRFAIPKPAVNEEVGRFTVDFIWRPQQLVVEVDGYLAHRGRQAFEDDRARELELGALGLRVRRFSAHQIAAQPAAVAAAVLAELGLATFAP